MASRAGPVAGPEATTTLSNLPGNFYYFFKHFLELNGGQTHLYLNFFFFFFVRASSVLASLKGGGALGVGECFVFLLMGNFLGSKWARFMNAFVGCLWGGARPNHPPWSRLLCECKSVSLLNGILNFHCHCTCPIKTEHDPANKSA